MSCVHQFGMVSEWAHSRIPWTPGYLAVTKIDYWDACKPICKVSVNHKSLILIITGDNNKPAASLDTWTAVYEVRSAVYEVRSVLIVTTHYNHVTHSNPKQLCTGEPLQSTVTNCDNSWCQHYVENTLALFVIILDEKLCIIQVHYDLTKAF